MRALTLAACRWAGLAALYLALVGQLARAEVVAAFLVAAAGAMLSLLLKNAGKRRFALGAPWLLLLRRVAAALLGDVSRIAVALARSILVGTRGAVATQPFSTHRGSEAEAGRQALVVLLASVAPNGFVVDVVEKQRVLSVHRLSRVPPNPDPEWPV